MLKFLLGLTICELSGSESTISVGTRSSVTLYPELRFTEGKNTPSIRAVKGMVNSVVSKFGECSRGGVS